MMAAVPVLVSSQGDLLEIVREPWQCLSAFALSTWLLKAGNMVMPLHICRLPCALPYPSWPLTCISTPCSGVGIAFAVQLNGRTGMLACMGRMTCKLLRLANFAIESYVTSVSSATVSVEHSCPGACVWNEGLPAPDFGPEEWHTVMQMQSRTQ